MYNKEKVTLVVTLLTITTFSRQSDVLFEEILAINDLDNVGCVWTLTKQNLPTQLTAQSITFNFDEEMGGLVSDWKFISKLDKVSHPHEDYFLCNNPMECIQIGRAVRIDDAGQILGLVDKLEKNDLVLLDLILVKTSPDTLSCMSNNKIFDALHEDSKNCLAQLAAFDTAFQTSTQIDGLETINHVVAYVAGMNQLVLVDIFERNHEEPINFVAKSTDTLKNIRNIRNFILLKIKGVKDKLYFVDEHISESFDMSACPRILQWAICHAWKVDCHTEHSPKEKAEMRKICTELITELGDIDNRSKRGILDMILQITNALGTLPRLTQGHNINIKNIKLLHYNELIIQNNLNHLASFVHEMSENDTVKSLATLTAMEHDSLKFLHLETAIAKQKLFHGLKETLNHLQIVVLSVLSKLNKLLQHLEPKPFDHPHSCNVNHQEIICQNGPGVISSDTTTLSSDISVHTSARKLEKTDVYFPRCLYKDGSIFKGNSKIFMKENGTMYNTDLTFSMGCVSSFSHTAWKCGHLMTPESDYDTYTKPAELGKDSKIFYLKFTKAIWIQYMGKDDLTVTNKQKEIITLSMKINQFTESNFPLTLNNKTYNFQDFVISHKFEEVFLQEEDIIELVTDPHPEYEISAKDRIIGFLDHLDELEDTPELGSVIRVSFYGIISLAVVVIILAAIVLFCWYQLDQKQQRIRRVKTIVVPREQSRRELKDIVDRIGFSSTNTLLTDLKNSTSQPPDYEDSAPTEETKMFKPKRGAVKVTH